MQMIVNGETFEVRQRPHRPDQYDFRWLTGPNPGYAFTSTLGLAVVSANGEPQETEIREWFERKIARFLSHVDPETGYLGG